MEPNKYGLNKLVEDLRDFSHHDTFGTIDATQLPIQDFTIYDQLQYTIKWGDTLNKIASYFNISTNIIGIYNQKIQNANKIYAGQVITIPARQNTILNQTDLDFCTAFATVELQNAIWGTQFDPYYQMAKIKQISGNISGYGASLRDAATSVVKYGSIPLKMAPYSYPGDKTRDFLANAQNYPVGLDLSASKEKDLSYFALDGTGDTFDNIRSALWTHRLERRAVTFGLFWHEAWTEAVGGIISDLMPNDSIGGGHDMAYVGQKTINNEVYIVGQQTWGPSAGDNGFYYFPRSIVNACFNEGYGAYLFSNKDASGLKTAGGFLTAIATFFNKLLGFI